MCILQEGACVYTSCRKDMVGRKAPQELKVTVVVGRSRTAAEQGYHVSSGRCVDTTAEKGVGTGGGGGRPVLSFIKGRERCSVQPSVTL